MKIRSRTAARVLALGAVLVLTPEVGHAYGGPGSVITGIGALIAVVAAVIAAVFGFLWFPVKRLLRRIRGEEPGDETELAAHAPEEGEQAAGG